MSGQHTGRPRDLVDAYVAAAFLSTPEHRITPGRIRRWAHDGKIARHGTDHRRCTLYSLAELHRVASDTPTVAAGS